MRPLFHSAVVVLALSACASVGTPAGEMREPAGAELGVVAQTLLDVAASKYRRVSSSWASGSSGSRAGTLWYLHEYTLDPVLREQAERVTARVRADSDPDPGYQLASSYGNAYRITREERFREPLLEASRRLADRARNAGDAKHPVPLGDLADLELLLWSASHGGDSQWSAVARRQGERALASQVRADRDAHGWARGQAWGIYGFAMLYRFTRDTAFLGAARRMAGYALRRLPDDYVPCPGDGRCQERAPRDVAAAAIMTSGLFELSTFATSAAPIYREAAEHMLSALASPEYLAPDSASSLLASSGGGPPSARADEESDRADYHFVEALMRYLQISGRSGVRVLEIP